MSDERWLSELRALDEARSTSSPRPDADLVQGALARGRFRRRRKCVLIAGLVAIPCALLFWLPLRSQSVLPQSPAPRSADVVAATDGLVERLAHSRQLLESSIRRAEVQMYDPEPSAHRWMRRRWEARAADLEASGRLAEAEAFLLERRTAHPEAFAASGRSMTPDNQAR